LAVCWAALSATGDAPAGAAGSAEARSAGVSAEVPSAAEEDSVEEVVVRVGNSCPSCGAVIERRAGFCPTCGVAVAARAVEKRGASMSIGKLLLILMLAVLLALGLVGSCFYSGYNRAVALDEEVKGKWAQVENQLQRRFELIPNLVETVKGFAAQEEKIFLGVADARKSYFQANTVAEKARAAGIFESALSRLLVLRETYPQLKSDESFLKLQDSLEGTENRLATERKRYNDAVKELNTFTRKLMGRIYSSLAGVEKAEYFEVSEEAKTAPTVSFTED
jgi:LemA protein